MPTNAPASEETARVDEATEQEQAAARGNKGRDAGSDDLCEPESLASADVMLVKEPTASGRRALPPPNPGATYRGADEPLPKPPRPPRLARVDSEIASEGDALDAEASRAAATASLPPPQDHVAPFRGESGSDRGGSLLPVVASTTRAGDRSADEPSASSRLRTWPPNRRLVAAAAIAVGVMAGVVWVAGGGVERRVQHAVHLGYSPAMQDAPGRMAAMARSKPPADKPTESRLPPPSAEPLDADESAAEPANEQGHPVAAKGSPNESASNEAGHADSAEPSSPDDERTADALKPFDRAAARAALNAAAIAASGCNKEELVAPPPAVVSVTFAPIGRATKSVVSGGPYAGTATGSCIAGAFQGVSVPAFKGGPMTAQITVTLR